MLYVTVAIIVVLLVIMSTILVSINKRDAKHETLTNPISMTQSAAPGTLTANYVRPTIPVM